MNNDLIQYDNSNSNSNFPNVEDCINNETEKYVNTSPALLLDKNVIWIGSLTLLSLFTVQLLIGGWNPNKEVKVAFIGNSIQYYNDCPRVMEAVSGYHIKQDSCLRGGASFSTLLKKGNGMKKRFNTTNALKSDGSYDIGAPTVYDLLIGDYAQYWDYLVMNDRTYYPASNCTLQQGMKVLKKSYIPMLLRNGATPILLANHATRSDNSRTQSFGNFENYTHLLVEGYNTYKNFLDQYLPDNQTARIAPVGKAYLQVYEEDEDLWYRLYHTDGLHPSPHGTYLQAIVMYSTIYGHPPPKKYALPRNPSNLFKKSRIMQPHGQDPLDRPTLGEAMYLYDVATRVSLTDYRVVTSGGWE